ncbi:glycyl radical enzyme [Desulfosarcina alkanivorans]|uniref:Glycyl radical enzyme n=1 Tax=Desulfosarcina alkanivorans TaxID=571177 RepID=A0A5K7YP77_9BACT|nr:pyruvate formate lyase family protein [Desulfosarcina alkanivorans]BBO70115.1 glycyl radical enzyme [Desulfosarcina alkanivorans]
MAMAMARKENFDERGFEVDEERIQRLKAQLLDTPQKLDIQRIEVLMESYRETEGLPHLIRRAKFFEKLMKEKGLYVDESLIVGSMAAFPMGIYGHPEWNIDWMKKDVKAMTHLGEVTISDEDKKLFEEVIAYWDGKTLNEIVNKKFEEIYDLNPFPPQMAGLFYGFATFPTGGGLANYHKVLTKGVGGIIKDVEERLKALPLSNVDAANEKRVFYEAVLTELRAVIHWAHRYAELAKDMAAKEKNPERVKELLEIAEICEWVPENVPRSFREAVQSLFFTHTALQIEQVGCGTSLGYMGQILEPFYQKDKQAGLITKEEAVYLLKMLFIKFQEMGYYFGQEYVKANSADMGQTISIGGITSDGKDATAELDYLLLDAQIALRNIQPTFALFYHDNLKEDFLSKAVDLVRTGVGQPQFMNTNIMVQRLLDQYRADGITLAEARRGAVAGCVATNIYGKTSFYPESDLCAAKALEFALNDGKDPLTGQQIGPKTGAAESFATYEDLYEAFRKQMQYGTEISRNHGKVLCMMAEEYLPIPLRSSLLDGCIENGKACWSGGAKYNTGIYIICGVVDTANSLAAVKKLVFEDKKLTMGELMKALEANFEGYEKIKKMCLNAPKHGNDDDEMTALVRKIYDDFLESYYKTAPCYLGKKGKPDAYSKSAHNLHGAVTGALPCGREARRALTDGSVSAMPGSDTNGPTALANSAAQAQDAAAFTSNHLNMKFHPATLEGGAGTRNLLSIVKGYMDKGGSHVQFNCVDSDTLKDAQAHPEKYRDLVVRVAGFSAYFIHLDKGVQDEVIRRTELKFH